MARYRVSALTAVGSTTLPIISLYGSTTVRPRLKELALFNTGLSPVQLKLIRLSTLGTATGLTEVADIAENPAPIAAAYGTHSGTAPTITAGDLYRMYLPSGGGIVLGFDEGIVIPAVANAGLGVVVSAGTGQICEAMLSWEE